MLAYFAISSFVRYFGAGIEEIIEDALGDPEQALYLALLVTLFALYGKIARQFRNGLQVSGQRFYVNPSIGGSVALAPPILNDEEIKVTAAHEAGHALVYAALGGTAIGVSIYTAPQRGVLGRTVSAALRVDSKQTLEVATLRCLAGQAAEKTIFGDYSTGAYSDVRAWQSLAGAYFGNGFRHLYVEPKSREEQAYNAQAYEALRAEQLNSLAMFFDYNRSVLADLAYTLGQTKKMDAEALAPFFERMVTADILSQCAESMVNQSAH